MQPSLNTPYVCRYKSDGRLLNPIEPHEPYLAYTPNRKARRESLNVPRFCGNTRGAHLTVTPTAAYRRVRQRYKTADGRMVWILHYLEG